MDAFLDGLDVEKVRAEASVTPKPGFTPETQNAPPEMTTDDVVTALEPIAVDDGAFAGFAEKIGKQRETDTLLALRQARESDPDQYAKARALATREAIPTDVALRNMGEIEADDRINRMAGVLKGNPALAGWVASPDNAGLVNEDDLRRLSGLPWMAGAVAGAYGEGREDQAANGLAWLELTGRASPEQVAALARAEADGEDRSFAADTWMQQGLVGAARMMPAMVDMGENAIMRGVTLGAPAGALTGAAVGGAAGAPVGGVGAIPGAIAGATSGAAVGFAAGARLGAVEQSFQDQAGNAFRALRKIKDRDGKSLDPEVVFGASMLVGGVNAGLDLLGLKETVGRIPGVDRLFGGVSGEMLQRIAESPTIKASLARVASGTARGIAVETLTEVGQELTQIAGEEASKAASDGSFDHATTKGAIDRLSNVAVETLKAMSVMGPLTGAAHLSGDVARVRQAKAAKATLDAIGLDASSDTLVSRDPGKAAEAARAASGDADPSFFVPAAKMIELFQTIGRDPFADLDDYIDGWSDNLTAAAAVGGDVEIRGSDLRAHIAPTDVYEALKPFIRESPDALNFDEATRANETIETDRRAEVDRLQVEAEREAEAAAPLDQVEAQMYENMVGGGKTPDSARQIATLWRSFYGSIGEKTGRDPLGLFRDRGVSVQRVLPEPLRYASRDRMDVLIDDVRAGKTGGVRRETERARGPSVGTFLARRGGLIEEGGELTAMDANKWKSGKLLAKKSGGGMTLDAATEAAWEEGYFGFGQDRPSQNELIAMIREEMAGRPVYVERNDAPTPAEEAIASLERQLDELGLDISTMTNDDVRAAFEGLRGEPGVDALFQFAGVRYANVPEPVTAQFDRAREMAADQSFDAEDIWRETGFFVGADQKWRWEISDEEAGFEPFPSYTGRVDADGKKIFRDAAIGDGANGFVGKLGDAFAHPALFAAYPDLADIKLVAAINPSEKKEHGYFEPSPLRNEIFVAAKTADTARSILLHELQHAIQDRERFAGGGNPDMGRIYEGEKVEEAHRLIETLTAKRKNIIRQWERYEADETPNGIEVRAGFERAWKKADDDLSVAQRQIERAAGFEFYRRIYGEVEARNVQERDRLRLSENPNDNAMADDLPVWTQDVQGEAVTNYDDATGPILILRSGGTSAYEAMGGDTAREFFQEKARKPDLAGEQPGVKRGSIEFREGQTIINLFEAEDPSTVLHESGHFFFEILRDLAVTDGDPALVDLWSKVKDELGRSGDEPLTREEHEKLAVAFEAYLFEGKAPSEALRGVFSRFRSWLVTVYRSIRNIGGPVSPRMREVMDRMLATDDEIATKARQDEYRPLFGAAADAGIGDAEYGAYARLAQKASDQARDDLQAELLGEIKRENTRAWKAAKTEMRERVRSEFERMPVYQAFTYLRSGKFVGGMVPATDLGHMRLDRAALVAEYGAGVLASLPRSVPPIYAAEGGVHPDLIADMFGFSSGDAMVRELMSAPPMGRAMNQEIDRRMREEHGDLMNNLAARAVAATEAMHSDERGMVLATEMRVLAKRGGVKGEVTPAKAASQIARESIYSKTVAKAGRVDIYAASERRAAKEAEASMLAGRFVAAAEAKRKQLFAHYLAMHSKNARRETEATVAYLSKWSRGPGPVGVDPEHNERIRDMLERFELRVSVSQKKVNQREALAAWIMRMEAEGEVVTIPADLRNEAFKKSYRSMTVDELMGVRDAVRNLEHLGRLKNKLVLAGKARELTAAAEDLAASARKHNKERRKGSRFDELTPKKRMLDAAFGVAGHLLRIEQAVEWLDGKDINGPWRRLIFQPISDAQNRENDMQVKYTAALTDALSTFPAGRLLEFVDVAGVGRVRRDKVLAVALNVGNASNRYKLLKGEAMVSARGYEGAVDTDAKLDAVLDTMTKDDWDGVQRIWDTINGLWPEIAAIEKRLTGVEPPKVEAVPVQTAHGTYPGGYYPLIYSAKFDEGVSRRQDEAADRLFENSYLKPDTERGFTKARNEKYARPIDLTLSVIANHVANVIHDFTHREAIAGVYKVLQQPNVREAVSDTLGDAVLKQFTPWLQRIANDRRNDLTSPADRFFMKSRTNMTAFSMGFRYTTVVMQVVGFSNSLELLKAKHLGPAVRDYLRDPIGNTFSGDGELTAFVTGKSGEMRHRMNTIDRDLRSGLRQVTGEDGTVARVKEMAFRGIGWMDRLVTVSTWKAAYDQQLVKTPRDEEAAIAYADRVVRQTQGAGSAKDISALQGQKGAISWLTMFYSYFNAYFNRMWNLGRDFKGAISEQRYADMPDLAARLLFLSIVPAVLGDLLVARGPDDEKEETYAGWALRKVLFYPMMGIPVARDIGNYWSGQFSFSMSPMQRLLEGVAELPGDATRALETGEPRDAIKSAAEVAGMAAGLPIGQPITTVNNVWRGLEEGDLSLRDLIMRRPPAGK